MIKSLVLSAIISFEMNNSDETNQFEPSPIPLQDVVALLTTGCLKIRVFPVALDDFWRLDSLWFPDFFRGI